MNNILAILKKQIKDTLKNAPILLQFVMFPAITAVFSLFVHIEDMPKNFFVNIFSSMYVGMAPLVSISSVISEEKEKGTLRALTAANVKPHQYLTAVGGYIWIICMLGSAVMGAFGDFTKIGYAAYMAAMAAGMVISLTIGAAIGMWSSSQMSSSSISVPVMLIFAFAPMLSMFNESIGKVAKYLYSEQLSRLLNHVNDIFNYCELWECACVFAANFTAALILFVLAYKKRGL